MKADILNLESLFGGPVSYRIPQFQRPYAWKQDSQWEPLWDDVSRIANECLMSNDRQRVRPHFMGAIVLQPQSSQTGEVQKRLVVDGQQRLTTLQLLTKAIEEAFRSQNDNVRAARLGNFTRNEPSHFAGDPNSDTKIGQSNLNDQTAFQHIIRNFQYDGHQPSSAIVQAFHYFNDRVTEYLSQNSPDYSNRAEALERTITSLIQIAVIDLDEDEEPHIIFETLNERGEQLSQSDRIKNTVMYEANVIDDADRARSLWGMFEDSWWNSMAARERLNRSQSDRFLNIWVMMRTQKVVSLDRVAPAFREFLKENRKTGIEDIAEELRTSAVVYRRMDEELIPGFETFLRRINILEAGVVAPLILWVHTNEISQEKRERIHKTLESYLVRRTLCGYPSMGNNRYFIDLLRGLERAGLDCADQALVEQLKSGTADSHIWPSDRNVEEVLINRPLRGRVGRQKMILEAIEVGLRSDKAESHVYSDQLTIEHIMPQAWVRYWPLPEPTESNPDVEGIRNSSVKKLGNLTLVTQKLNSSVSNGPWSEKKAALHSHSSLFLNKTLLDNAPEVWDEEAIHERGCELALQILRIL